MHSRIDSPANDVVNEIIRHGLVSQLGLFVFLFFADMPFRSTNEPLWPKQERSLISASRCELIATQV